MPKLLIKLTPLDPYFLGGEHIFEKGDGNKHYFIKSLDTPSQTTLFGALRYIGVKNPAKGFVPNDDTGNIGESSYKINCPPGKCFGKIDSISPLYLLDKDGAFWIPTPFDHEVACACHKEYSVYTRFEEYSDSIPTVNGQRRFPKSYNAKDGHVDSWLCLRDRRIRSDLFESITHVGVNKQNTDKAFFKKAYKRLKDNFCFAFFADVKTGFVLYQSVVYLGQGKSGFQVEFIENVDVPKIPSDLIRPEIVYAQSDIYYTGDIQKLYSDCQFVSVKTRTHRIFEKDYRNRTNSAVVQLMQAGSVFWPNDAAKFEGRLQDLHAAVAGLNHIVIGGNSK